MPCATNGRKRLWRTSGLRRAPVHLELSFLRGASHADDIAARAAQLGYAAIAVTDECSLAGVVRAHVEAKNAGIPFIVGSGFALIKVDGSRALRFTALAMTREGYGNLSELITLGRMRADKGQLPAHCARS